jgi:hypothetical protein
MDAGAGWTGVCPKGVGAGDAGAWRDMRLPDGRRSRGPATPLGARVTVASSQDTQGRCVWRDNARYRLAAGGCCWAVGVSGS